MIFSHGTSDSRGVIVAFRHGLEYKMLSDPICDLNGRYIGLGMEIQGSHIFWLTVTSLLLPDLMFTRKML